MIEELKKNIESEIAMWRELSEYKRNLEETRAENEKRVLGGAIDSLKVSMKTINESIPELLVDIKIVNKLPSEKIKKKEEKKFTSITFQRDDSPQLTVVLSTKNKDKFLKELSISESYIKKIKKRKKQSVEKYGEFKGARGYLKIANKFFLERASREVGKGKYSSLSVGIRKANLDLLLESYIAMMYFTIFLVTIFSICLVIFLLFVEVGLQWPFLQLYTGNYLLRIGKIFWIPFVLPFLSFLIIFYYPSSEQKSIERKINEELPFAVIYMGAISGSGIEPSQIFKIIGMNKDYPALKHEIRKILNQINLYGYDLVTALNNAAKTSPSERLGELLSGMSTTVTSGARMQDFLEKRAESLLVTYRLEREQYTKLVETILDIYISIVIAAPMIFLLMITMLSLTESGVGLAPSELSLIGVLGIAVLNIVFMIFIQLKQPSY